jgi:hypothetical protein
MYQKLTFFVLRDKDCVDLTRMRLEITLMRVF